MHLYIMPVLEGRRVKLGDQAYLRGSTGQAELEVEDVKGAL